MSPEFAKKAARELARAAATEPKRTGGTLDINITLPAPRGDCIISQRDACRAGIHRPANLVRGGVACGYCGTPM